jgi:hypothetical protein
MKKRSKSTSLFCSTNRWTGTAALLLALLASPAPSFLVEATPSSKDHVTEPPKAVCLHFGSGVGPANSDLTIETWDVGW